MNIEEIRAEIPKVFTDEPYDVAPWIWAHGDSSYQRSYIGGEDEQVAANMLVDMAYKAGLKRANENSLSALNDAELRGNPIYQKGYEAGKFDGQKGGVLFNAVRQVGFDEAAKDPKAWYVLDKNGEQVHIGDGATKDDSAIREVAALGEDIIYFRSGSLALAKYCEKVIPDTREKIKEELGDVMLAVIEHDLISFDETLSADDLAEQFIARIEALVE